MPSTIGWRLRIRDAADSVDVLSVSSVRGDTNPDALNAPSGDGAEFDPFTGSYRSGSMTFSIGDAITSGTDRVVTAQLEDATFRQQLTSRPAYIERSIDGGSWQVIQAGIVTGLRLVNGAQWDIDIGDATRATRNLVAFAPKRDATDATKVEPFADYLARWPHRGCLAGGPITGGFLTIPDLGGWEMVVGDTRSWNGGTIKGLVFKAGYDAPDFSRTKNPDDVRDALNDALGDPFGLLSSSTFPDDLAPSALRDVVVEVNGDPYAAATRVQGSASPAAVNMQQGYFLNGNPYSGFDVADPSNTLTVGDSVRVRIYDALPSDRCPIYYSGHPLDLWTALCDEAGLAYDSAAALSTKQALGTSIRINLRITSSQAWASFVESTLYGPCGFSVRTGADGTLVPFPTRITSSALPSVEVTNADVPQTGVVLFDLSEPDAITKVTFNQQNLRPATALSQQSGNGRTAVARGTATTTTRTAQQRVSPSLDGITVQSVQVIRTSGDSGGPVQREQSYTIPGFLDTGSGAYEPGLVDAIAYQLFDRAGRGRLTGELALLREGSAGAVVLGDEVLVSLKAMPNHNKRYGDDATVGGRCVQILRLTPTAWGAMAKVMDSGPNAQPATPLPTITLAAGPAGGGVAMTIANAATLNAAGIAVRVQWAPVASGTPASTVYSDVLYFAAGAVPTGATLLPLAPAGYTVFVKGRSEQANKRPSAYSTAVSLATGAMGAPTGLSVTVDGSDGSKATVAWTTGTSADAALIDIYLRLSTLTFPDAIRMATGLFAGTIQYPLSGLIPGDAYIVTVVERDPVSGATASAEYTFTAGSTTRTLSPPTDPVGVVGSTDPSTGVGHLDGTYGLDVTAAELPGYVTFWEAVETMPGSGTYGSFAQVSGLVPSVSGGPTSWRGVSSNAALRKQLKARHEADGTNPSTYTAPVTLDAWGVVLSPPVAGSGSGPSLDARGVADPVNYTITYAGSGGTIDLDIDGGGYGVPPASPFTVARPAAGSAPLAYTFRIVGATQTITDKVLVMPLPGATGDTDTVSPDLSVSQDTPTTTSLTIHASASNPKSGGPAPTLTFVLTGTTAQGSPPYSAGTVYAMTNPGVLVVDRPAFDPTTQASITIIAAISGGGSEEYTITIPNQVKTSFGPSLDVKTVVSSSSVSITYADIGTVELSIDGGAYSAAPASPITVTRDSSDHSYHFRVVLDSQTVPGYAFVPALAGVGGTTPAFSSVGVTPYTSTAYTGAGTTTARASWSMSSPPSGVSYDGTFEEETGANVFEVTRVSGITSPYDFTTSQLMKSTGATARRIRFTVQAIVGSTVSAQSQTEENTVQVF